MRHHQYKAENLQGKKEDEGETTGINTVVKEEDKGGNVCIAVVLITAQVEDAQCKYTDKGEVEDRNAWVVIVPARVDNAENGENDGESEGDNT